MAHYPSDVLVAALVGSFSAVAAWLIAGVIFRELRKRRKQPLCRFILYYDPLRFGKLHRNSR
jgi:membrane-associated phospholipid phosphatase